MQNDFVRRPCAVRLPEEAGVSHDTVAYLLRGTDGLPLGEVRLPTRLTVPSVEASLTHLAELLERSRTPLPPALRLVRFDADRDRGVERVVDG